MTSPTGDLVALSEEELARFAREGFLVVDRPVVAPQDLAEARGIIASLFDKFDQLPREYAYDLGDVKHHDGPQQTPEINRTSMLEPRLAKTAAFARCRDLARQILGNRVEGVYDHAICKPPNNGASIEWHQDLAYGSGRANFAEVHMWLALQDVTETNGCMQFIPYEGSGRLLPHHRRGIDAHALVAEGFDRSAAVACPVAAGMVTIHQLTTLHSSGPNLTDEPRFAWILHFRDCGRGRVRTVLSKIKRSLLPRPTELPIR